MHVVLARLPENVLLHRGVSLGGQGLGEHVGSLHTGVAVLYLHKFRSYPFTKLVEVRVNVPGFGPGS